MAYIGKYNGLIVDLRQLRLDSLKCRDCLFHSTTDDPYDYYGCSKGTCVINQAAEALADLCDTNVPTEEGFNSARQCQICANVFPLYGKTDLRLICPECCKRLSKLLYPEEWHDD